jgi:hypothetical protein
VKNLFCQRLQRISLLLNNLSLQSGKKGPRKWDAKHQLISVPLANLPLFAAEVFGGQVRGNFFHQWVALPDGQHLDLNDEAQDVADMLRGEIPADTSAYAAASRKRLPASLYTHDPRHMKTRDNRDSMASIRPRVDRWVAEFLQIHR